MKPSAATTFGAFLLRYIGYNMALDSIPPLKVMYVFLHTLYSHLHALNYIIDEACQLKENEK